jgi:hypothetical protein
VFIYKRLYDRSTAFLGRLGVGQSAFWPSESGGAVRADLFLAGRGWLFCACVSAIAPNTKEGWPMPEGEGVAQTFEPTGRRSPVFVRQSTRRRFGC